MKSTILGTLYLVLSLSAAVYLNGNSLSGFQISQIALQRDRAIIIPKLSYHDSVPDDIRSSVIEYLRATFFDAHDWVKIWKIWMVELMLEQPRPSQRLMLEQIAYTQFGYFPQTRAPQIDEIERCKKFMMLLMSCYEDDERPDIEIIIEGMNEAVPGDFALTAIVHEERYHLQALSCLMTFIVFHSLFIIITLKFFHYFS